MAEWYMRFLLAKDISQNNQRTFKSIALRYNGLFPPTETEMETDPHTDSCNMQVFTLVRRRIPIPLLKYSKIGTEIHP